MCIASLADRHCLRSLRILKNGKTWIYSLYDRPSLPLAVQNPENERNWICISSMTDRHALRLAVRNPEKWTVLECVGLYGRPSLPPAVRKFEKWKDLDV